VLASSYFWLLVVPLFAKLLARTGTEIRIPISEPPLVIHLGLPFSWKVFYWSSVAFAVATLLFTLRCPEFVRNHASFREYSEEGKGPKQILLELASLLWRPLLPTHGLQLLLGFEKHFLVSVGNSNHFLLDEKAFITREIKQGAEADAFWFVYEYAAAQAPVARLLCAVFYVIGFVLLGVVMVQNLWYVAQFTFQ
jgi:hypothetical protein